MVSLPFLLSTLFILLYLSEDVASYERVSNIDPLPSLAFFDPPNDTNRRQLTFHVVIPYTEAYLIRTPALRRSIESWRQYSKLHNYTFTLLNTKSIIQRHGQRLKQSVESRHSFVYVTGKPLVALCKLSCDSRSNAYHLNMSFISQNRCIPNAIPATPGIQPQCLDDLSRCRCHGSPP